MSSHEGTLSVCSTSGSIDVAPEPGRVVRFGRGGKEADFQVDLRVGADDQGVSRRHGELTYEQGLWWLRNVGQRPLRLPAGPPLPQQLDSTDDPVPLEVGLTQVYVTGELREHVVELFVVDAVDRTDRIDDRTVPPKKWRLDDDERLVLLVMGQRYLREDPEVRPLTYREAALELESLHPEKIWGDEWAEKRRTLARSDFLERLERKIEYTVEKVRRRLTKQKFPYALKREPGGPSDDRLKHNLIHELVRSTTLTRSELDRLYDEPTGPSPEMD